MGVYLDYNQAELDDAYDQTKWAENMQQTLESYTAQSTRCCKVLGPPDRFSYGSVDVERLSVFRTAIDHAPVHIFVHGGSWRTGTAAQYAFPAEGFVSSGAHYVALDFSSILDVAGDLGALVSQVRRAIAWIYRNAHTFGGDPERLYIGGHSSGAHLAAAALTTDWRQWDTPSDILKGGILMSGMYDLYPVHLSARSRYVSFDNAVVDSFSPCRHISRLSAPIVVAWGTKESPEFVAQGEFFARAVASAGKSARTFIARDHDHFEMMNLFTSNGPLGRLALEQMACLRSEMKQA
jgi:arylformamidase